MTKQMMIGVALGNGYGAQNSAWRMPWVDPANYTSFDSQVRYAQAAERGRFQFLFLPDYPALKGDVAMEAPWVSLEPMLTLAAIARETNRIGLVATGSTTFNEPYNLARQFKTLDIMSHGRVGWNAVPSWDPAVAANFGRQLPPREEKYQRLHEVVQLVQALWGSWERDAWVLDTASGQFADPAKIKPINLSGRHVGARGPLPLPPSEQGQPVIFQAGGGGNGLEVAGRYATGVMGAPQTMEDARHQRSELRAAAQRAGRDPDEIKYFAGIMTTVASDRRAGLDRRILITEHTFADRVVYLGQMLGLRLESASLDAPLSPEQLAAARPSPADPRSVYALQVAREGWNLRDVLAHGVIEFHPAIAGPSIEIADFMQAWFEADAADGFWVVPDVFEDGIDAFVDGVVPILQERGLFHRDYEGHTLRHHLGAPAQYGTDTRVLG